MKMKHKIFSMIGAGLLLASTWSCRQDSDLLSAYDHKDNLVFAAADTSFAAKFKIIWNGMNQNYCLWDYESEYGMDWDAVYDEYYPQFAALDKRDSVPDDELKDLMQKMLSPLHDHHMHIDVKNHKTGHTVVYMPGLERNASRDDYMIAAKNKPSLRYYANVANGEVETDADGNAIAMQYSTALSDLITAFAQTPGIGFLWIKARIQELQDKPSRTELEDFQLQQLNDLLKSIMLVGNTLQGQTLINAWNSLQSKYSFLNVPGFDYIDPGFDEKGIGIHFALLKGNIVYLYISGFALTPYLNEEYSAKVFGMSHPTTQQRVALVKQVWQAWFDIVQQLNKSGQLSGVILDVRGNMGGMVNDMQYFVGALTPSGGHQYGYQRYKRGSGRYDYSPLMPAICCTMSDPHEIIEKPIVILTNCLSVSMSEMSTRFIHDLSNGTHIGKRTWGGECPLATNDDNSYNYSGHFGVDGVTAVYGYIPTVASFSNDKKIEEGQGIMPDIEVDLDEALFNATGQDTQLDRALQFIRNH